MNYSTRVKVKKLRNNLSSNENIPYDLFLDELIKLNDSLWNSDDYEYAKMVCNKHNTNILQCNISINT
ncbi:hypothetical protein [Clostridium perfringens]|uniref:hypothetical protein n=1 Tax=Clostridium perfringens TaxID=1502 RepID=UPI0032DB46B5